MDLNKTLYAILLNCIKLELKSMSAKENLVNGGDFIKGDALENERCNSKVIKHYNDVIAEELAMSNKILVSVRRRRLRELFAQEKATYLEELALEDKTTYQHRL